MDLNQIKKYWRDSGDKINRYNISQLNNPRLLKSTIDFLVICGLPDNCAPMIGFDECKRDAIPTPNEVFKIDFDGLDEYLMIGGNGSGDPICIDLNLNNEIVYLNHDNYFERVFMNSSVHQLAECIIFYRNFYFSLDPKFENNVFHKRKFSDAEFQYLKRRYVEMDNKCLDEGRFWRESLDYLLWERDNEIDS